MADAQAVVCASLRLQEASKAAALVDTGLMSDAAAGSNGVASSDLLTAGKDTDLVF